MSGDGVVPDNPVPWSQVNVFLVFLYFVDDSTDRVFTRRADRQVENCPVGDFCFERNGTTVWSVAWLGTGITERYAGCDSQIPGDGRFRSIFLGLEELTG
jgi:hypothetical protein